MKQLKALDLVKEILLAKIKGSNEVLKKYGLRRIDYSVIEQVNDTHLWLLKDEELKKYRDYGVFPLDALDKLRIKYLSIEGRMARNYVGQIFSMFPESLRPSSRRGFKAYDGINNTFNLAYRILFNKVFVALIRAKLEPYLGFYHTTKFGTPSLALDFMELYRYLMDDFLISYCSHLTPKDFELKADTMAGRKGKRVFLNKRKNKEFLIQLEEYFQAYVLIHRVRMGRKQRLNSLISEEALQLARFLRCEITQWVPRIVNLTLLA
jgi:CRISPR-associated protein Cas1